MKIIATDYFDAIDLKCEIGNLTHAVNVEWENYNSKPIKVDAEGYTIDQGVLDNNNVQTSTLTISADELKTIFKERGLYTTWGCTVQSIKFPRSKRGRRNLIVEYLLIGKKLAEVVL